MQLLAVVVWAAATSTTEAKSFLQEASLSQEVNRHAGSHDPAFLCLEFGGAKHQKRCWTCGSVEVQGLHCLAF